MASCLRCDFSASVFDDSLRNRRLKCALLCFPTVGTLRLNISRSKDLMGKSVVFPNQKGIGNWNLKSPVYDPLKPICVSKILKWWEKTLKPNMVEIKSAQEFVESLLNSGGKLVVVHFFSPGCGGCRALHPKICQLAEANPDAIFFTVNMDELRTMCSAIRVNMVPFFRFYRGARGKLCSFSCTPKTINKLKDALEKFRADDYVVGPVKGLEDYELSALASAGEISRKKTDDQREDLALHSLDLYNAIGKYEKSEREIFTLPGLDLTTAVGKYENGSKEDIAVVLAYTRSSTCC